MDEQHFKMTPKSYYTANQLSGDYILSGASGVIIINDLKNNLIKSTHFLNGNIDNNKIDKLITISKNSTINYKEQVNNLNDGPDPIGVECTEWYWNTYINGELVSSIYVGTTCLGSGGGGGSEGGTNGQELIDFINTGTVESGDINEMTISNNGTDWNVSYDWLIYSAGTWGLLSYENAALKKIHYSNYSRWEYQTFTHNQIVDYGTSFGGNRTFEDIGATINMTQTHQTAWVRIDFKITHSVPGFFGTAIPYNANKTFFAP